MSSIEKTGPLICVSIICIGSIGQLNSVLSIFVLSCWASKTMFSDSPFLSIINALIFFGVGYDDFFLLGRLQLYWWFHSVGCNLEIRYIEATVSRSVPIFSNNAP